MSGLLIDPILAGIGTTDELWDLTKIFVQIICFGFIFQSLGMGLNNFLRTAGRPNLALGTMIFGTVMCIIFNYLFVIVLGFGRRRQRIGYDSRVRHAAWCPSSGISP